MRRMAARASDRASWITGSKLPVDGGLAAATARANSFALFDPPDHLAEEWRQMFHPS